MSAFDKIKLGLEEAIAYEKGDLPAKTTVLSVLRSTGSFWNRSFSGWKGRCPGIL